MTCLNLNGWLTDGVMDWFSRWKQTHRIDGDALMLLMVRYVRVL